MPLHKFHVKFSIRSTMVYTLSNLDVLSTISMADIKLSTLTLMYFIKLTYFPIIFQFRSDSSELKYCHYFTMFCDIEERYIYII